MASSIKMIKATDVVGGETTAKIDTKMDEEYLESEQSYAEESKVTQVKIAQKKSQELLLQAEKKRKELIEATYQEIEDMKKTAYEEAYQTGKEAGYKEGYQNGLAEGLQQAEIENEAAKENIQKMLQIAQQGIEAYQFDKKEELIQLASHMAEKIVHKEIDESDKGVLQLARPYFYQLDKDEEFVSITVHPTQQEQVEQHLPEIERISPNTRFIIFADPQIEETGVVIESTKAVIDLQIKKQLDAMLQEFEEKERTVDA